MDMTSAARLYLQKKTKILNNVIMTVQEFIKQLDTQKEKWFKGKSNESWMHPSLELMSQSSWEIVADNRVWFQNRLTGLFRLTSISDMANVRNRSIKREIGWSKNLFLEKIDLFY